MLGEAFTLRIRLCSSKSSVDNTARMLPWVLMCRTSARVSISEITGMPKSARNSSVSSTDRQLLASSDNSRTTSPSAKGEDDSESNGLVP